MEVVDLALLAVGGTALCFFLLPIAVSWFGWSTIRFTPFPGPTGGEPDGSDLEYAKEFDEWKSLGFRPLGRIRERSWFNGHEFRKTFWVQVFQGSDSHLLATVYRMFPGSELRYSVASITDRNAMIQTAMPGVGEAVDRPDYFRKECSDRPLSGLLAAHRETVQERIARHGDRVVPVDLERYAELDCTVSAPYAKLGAGLGCVLLGLGWLAPFAAFLGLAYILGADNWPRAVGISSVIAALSYYGLAFRTFPKFLQATESCRTDGDE